MVYPDDVPRRIAAARGYAGISQEALSEDLGISQSTLARIEAGGRMLRPHEVYGMLPLIAAHCGLPAAWFTVDLARLGEIAPTA